MFVNCDVLCLLTVLFCVLLTVLFCVLLTVLFCVLLTVLFCVLLTVLFYLLFVCQCVLYCTAATDCQPNCSIKHFIKISKIATSERLQTHAFGRCATEIGSKIELHL